MTPIDLPPMPRHPEPHIYVWSQMEMRAIKDYATAAVMAACAALAQPVQPAEPEVRTQGDAMTNRKATQKAYYAVIALQSDLALHRCGSYLFDKALNALRQALAQPVQPALSDIEQYRLQMAAISTAALGYWKAGDAIHPDYRSVALNDVADLYKKYDELYQQYVSQPVQPAPQSP